MDRRRTHVKSETDINDKMERAAEFELISPHVCIKPTTTQFVLIRSNQKGLLRLKDLCSFCNVPALFIDYAESMYIADYHFENLIYMTMNLQENEFAIESNFDVTIPRLFYDLVFTNKATELNIDIPVEYIVESNSHLQDTCKTLIDNNPYAIVTMEDAIKSNPDFELDLSYFDLEFLHSLKFMHYFEELCPPNAYYSVDEYHNSSIHPDYSFCPDILLRGFKYPDLTEKEVNQMYVEWKRLAQEERKLMAKFECQRGGSAYDMYPMTQTHETHGTYSLRHIFDFCNWAMGIEQITNLYWYLRDVEILMELIDLLKNYRHIKCVDDLFIERDEAINWYVKECQERRALIEKFRTL